MKKEKIEGLTRYVYIKHVGRCIFEFFIEFKVKGYFGYASANKS